MEQFHPLDRLINNNSYAFLEALVPFVDYPYKQWLVLFIKYKEAMAILNCFNNRDFVSKQGFDCHPKTTEDFVSDLCQILPKQYASNLQNIKQVMQVMQMMDMTGAANTSMSSTSTENSYSKPFSFSQNHTESNLYNSVMDILNDTD